MSGIPSSGPSVNTAVAKVAEVQAGKTEVANLETSITEADAALAAAPAQASEAEATAARYAAAAREHDAVLGRLAASQARIDALNAWKGKLAKGAR